RGGARDVLRQVAHRRAAGLTHSPGVWLLESGEDATQRGLAGTVRTDEPDALAPGDLPGEILEEVLATKALRDALGLDQHLPHSLYVLGQYLDRDANLARARFASRSRYCPSTYKEWGRC